MDDYVGSCSSVEMAQKLTSDIIYIHSKGSFTICGWNSNSEEVLKTIPFELQAVKDENGEKVLGLIWKIDEDVLMCQTKSTLDKRLLEGNILPTKREALKIILHIFDPLGIAAIFLAEGKRIMQDIWRTKIEWDEQIPETLRKSWNSWLNNIQEVVNLKVPRCYGSGTDGCEEVQLHIFCDASEKTYATVAYIRTIKRGNIEITLIASKHRVAPLKPITIPRLELLAAVLGCKLRKIIVREHTIRFTQTFMWTDSKTVLLWIRGDENKFKTFVANRVDEIKKDTKVEEWRWVPTDENTADYATRTKTIREEERTQWFYGPNFLHKPETNWPKEDFNNKHKTLLETKKKYIGITKEVSFSKYLPEIERFSTLEKLLNVTAFVIRFIKILKKEQSAGVTLNLSELEEAKKLWIKSSQSDSFRKELETVKAGMQLEGNTKLQQVTPFIDEDGILRVKSRLSSTKYLPFDTSHPVILDPNHRFTKLLIDDYHKKSLHQGQETVVNEIKQKYWIFHLRKAVRSSWNRCKLCALRRAKPVPPQMGILPEVRLTPFTPPFTNTGIDYFGPIHVTVGRRREKRYGVLFTCLSIRAIHLEIAHSLTSASTIMAIQRFVARRGTPKSIYSDNGTNLRKASKEIKEALDEIDSNYISNKLITQGIEWHFIPPGAPHMGGSWERMIRTVKIALEICLKERFPKDEVLHTVFTEIENVVNNRPLTRVSMDPNDEESLSPNHFLIGRRSAMPLGKSNDCLRKSWRIAQEITNNFWQRWIKEYLPQLNCRTKWAKETRPINEGELVLMADPNGPRSVWKKGIIVRTYPGKDGQIRVVDVKTEDGIYRRPCVKICRIGKEENL